MSVNIMFTRQIHDFVHCSDFTSSCLKTRSSSLGLDIWVTICLCMCACASASAEGMGIWGGMAESTAKCNKEKRLY